MVSSVACYGVDTNYRAGVAALESGDYLRAYEQLALSENSQASALLEKLVFVPIKRTEGNTCSTYSYDQKGNLISEDNNYGTNGATTQYTYNEQNQLVYIETVNAEKIKTTTAYTYDESGNRISQEWVCDGNITKHDFTYDKKNRCIRKVQTDADGSVFDTVMRYDKNGNMTYEKITYPNGEWYERIIEYTADNKPLCENGGSRDSSYENSYTYNEAGLLIKKTVAGKEYSYTYDEKGRLTKEIEPDGAVITYAYDEKGNCLLEKHVTAEGNEYTTENTYDNEGRLMSSKTNTGGIRRFTYDIYGNKLTEECGGDTAKDYFWEYTWELHYYPDGVPEEVENIRLANINLQAVM